VTATSALLLSVATTLASAAPGGDAWARTDIGGVRGITIGPIENAYHPGIGYGSPAFDRALVEAQMAGATWVAITPFGRVANLTSTAIDLTFEVPFERNRIDVLRAIDMAHARGLRVMLVPHLWVESGQWRGDIDPGSTEAWARWADSYSRFLGTWARLAEIARAEMLSVGVELTSWVTSGHAPTFQRVVRDIRSIYHGLLTYSANWDDVEKTTILSDLDVIGINAFYPLADRPGAQLPALAARARAIRDKLHRFAEMWRRPVLFTEMGYTTRHDPALRPWEWPDSMNDVSVDERAQADAYRALLAPMLEELDFAGFFVWRVYADPNDVSQEAPWGFSPRGKEAELVLRDAFAAHWASDVPALGAWGRAAHTPGFLP
jgi:hypothetical protein